MTPPDRTVVPAVASSVQAPIGAATMSPAMAEMRAYPRYLLDQVLPSLGDRVWEIGVGHGQYTAWLREAGKTVLATDIDPACVQQAATRFQHDSGVVTAQVDLTHPETVLAQRSFRADSLICFNVLEHLDDDVSALQVLRAAVEPAAVLGIIVPAHPQLFGKMDAEAGHFRRYTRQTLRQTIISAGWQVQQTRYLNLLGAVGWWYHNRLRKSAGLDDARVNRQMRGADRWLPRVARCTDWFCGSLAGLSVLAIATTPQTPVSGG